MKTDSRYISQVHEVLKTFLRHRSDSDWPHHLTMARLVARGLQMGRSTLIQTGSDRDRYGLSYLCSVLLCPQTVVLVAPKAVQQHLLNDLIPPLQEWLESSKEVMVGDRVPPDFSGLVVTTPQAWLRDRLSQQGNFPDNIPTLIDPADDLEEWTRQHLTTSLDTAAWQELMQAFESDTEAIRDLRVKLTKIIFNRPANPYNCHLLSDAEATILDQLFEFRDAPLPPAWQAFQRQRQDENQLTWIEVARSRGQFTLHIAPVEVASALQSLWLQQPVVLIGGFLDWEADAPIYRQQLGLGDITCLKFSPNRQNEHIQLYLPDRLPLPNTPHFREVAIQQSRLLVSLARQQKEAIAILVDDVPLKAQVGAALAAEWGSIVQVEKSEIAPDGVLVSGWSFWRSHQHHLPSPQLLIIATLPLPSIEHPLVAGRVAYHKRQHQDWFRRYLLPTALRELQRAVVPLRQSQGTVALLDNRINNRSYGNKIFTALEPFARINYIEGVTMGC
ncbi:MAG: helicase C-terminal domain-containing protein [Jaaginema sp. PMC 1079.18]|nr:helicase C-terminal domain-containing protein [Jaaginema sp. PMC 1080.18]MEC4853065.1 helicase C-terminal domain-containing protein [Jaaginema sp. PMC 1079.18]MEC4864621.1 helicase C-terminal domain-containing protein [Jaaginema sp. PMC 1078.18]